MAVITSGTTSLTVASLIAYRSRIKAARGDAARFRRVSVAFGGDRRCYLGCGGIRTHDMLIIDVGVIHAGTDGQASLIQLLAMLAEQFVEQLRVLLGTSIC